MDVEVLGWTPFFQKHFDHFRQQGMVPARVAEEHKSAFILRSEFGELSANVSGKMRHEAQSRSDFPAVGDWVAVQPRADEGKAIIHAVLPRKSAFIRKEAGGRTEGQVVAANVDTVFLVVGLDHDFNPRRIERYLTVAWDSGANPVVVLNKADVCTDVAACVEAVEGVAMGVPAHAVSAVKREAAVIQWADDNPVVWKIVTQKKSKAFGLGSCVETEEWRHEGTHLECTCIEDGQDCDGRLTVSKEFKAMLPGPDHTVRWHESKSEVYDQFAQAAGY